MRLTQKQERFTLNIFEGMSQRDAYINAGYSSKSLLSTIDHNASLLANNSKILTRLAELNKVAEDASIATVLERKQVLTEIIRGRFIDFMRNLTAEKLKSAALQEIRVIEYGKEVSVKTTTIKLHSPIQAIDLLNKMEKIYEDGATVNIDNRTLNIEVVDAKGKLTGILNRLAARAGETEGDRKPEPEGS